MVTVWGNARLPNTPITGDMVNAERERRLAAGFIYNGWIFQARAADLTNFAGKALRADRAIAAGAESGNLRWNDPDVDFGWITATNVIAPLDAYEMIELAEAADRFVTRMIFIGRQLKDMLEAGEAIELNDDSMWGPSPQ